MNEDRSHSWWLDVKDGYTTMHVTCGYRDDDKTRPCWPADEDGTPMLDSDGCVYQGWLDNLGMEDLFHGKLKVRLDARPEWDNGSLIVRVEGVAR